MATSEQLQNNDNGNIFTLEKCNLSFFSFFFFNKHLNFYLTFKVDFHFLDEWRDQFVSLLAYPAKKVCKKLVDLAGI